MPAELIGSDQTFSKAERQMLAAIANATISEDPIRHLPGAGDAKVMPIILHKAEHFAARLKKGLDILRAEVDPLAVSANELLQHIEGDGRLRSFYRVLTIAILQGYYQCPNVLQALDLADRPPFPQGHEVESGDWSLLDSVKSRAPFYRPT